MWSVIAFLICPRLSPNLVAYNLIPWVSQGPNKTQVAHSNSGNPGKFTYKSVGRAAGHYTLRVSEQALLAQLKQVQIQNPLES